ncbi:MAG: ferrous iron transport protein B [candidate division Zixibacteria bacterium]|nr:ferrous iron transport protein B [candidate division Zixibacteria bacterium]
MGIRANIESSTRPKTIAVCGNPNSGKTTIFNAMTGLRQKVANYPGVTVEKVSGYFTVDKPVRRRLCLVDIPGSYSLSAFSPDERIAVSALHGSLDGSSLPDAIVCVIDATNLERGLYFLYQILQIGQPVVVALNMIDLAGRKGIEIDIPGLQYLLGGVPVVPVVGNRGHGISRLKEEVAEIIERPFCPLNHHYDPIAEELLTTLRQSRDNGHFTRAEYLRVIFDVNGPLEERFLGKADSNLLDVVDRGRKRLIATYGSLSAAETSFLGKKAEDVCRQVLRVRSRRDRTTSEKVDRFLLHPVLGPLVLLAAMVFIFHSIFSWAEPFMELIDTAFGGLAGLVAGSMAEGPLRSLLADGVIGGVGSVLIFIPQIAILFIFISILEDSGYMSRAAFLVDRMFRWCGLSGKSFIPMLSSFACAVPGIMATRTIEDRKLRFITIMVAPLMTCSARLPVYSIMIAAFIPYKTYWSVFNLQGAVLSLLYLLGVIVAVVVSFILSKTLLKTERGTFLMEMPSYKLPTWKSVVVRVVNRLKTFVIRAGTVILAITIIIWALSYYPRPAELADKYEQQAAELSARNEYDRAVLETRLVSALNGLSADESIWVASLRKRAAQAGDEAGLRGIRDVAVSAKPDRAALVDAVMESSALDLAHARSVRELSNSRAGEFLRQSFFGRIGRIIEPVFRPLGWDWKITMSVLAGFPAREVIIATLGTIYNLGSEVDEESASLVQKMRHAKWDSGAKVGRPVFTPAVALSIMVFFALCCQCGATLVTIRQETARWLYPAVVFAYMTTLAYLFSLVAYQILSGMGL